MRSLTAAAVCLLSISVLPAVSRATDFRPVDPEEIQLKEVPGAKGAHAVLLYYEDVEDDQRARETFYERIKILTEEGKKYANVELAPSVSGFMNVTNLKARVIRPDGSIMPFEGKAFDKVVAKHKGTKVVTKTFSIPDVQVGSIIEFTYMREWDPHWVFDSRFKVQQELFIRKAHFELVPAPTVSYSYTWFHLPPGVQPKKVNNKIVLDIENMPAFETEKYMPPSDEVRASVVFFAQTQNFVSADKFWKDESKKWRDGIEKFMDKQKAMEREVASIVQPSDDPESKLRKIYARVQKIENLSYEREKTEKEQEREKRKDLMNVEDVLKYGYGYQNSLNPLFVALARAAGFDASVVRVAERYDSFFHKEILSFNQLGVNIGMVRLNGKEMYFSPGTPYCPFGLLPWEDTTVVGVRADRSDKNGATFIQTPNMPASATVTARKANLRLDRDGTLSGEMTVTFTGQEALRRRLEARDEDETKRKKDLEDEVKGSITNASTVELVKVDKWESTEPLSATFKLSIPGYAAGTGKRLIVPSYAFSGAKGHGFQQAKRVQPIYFSYSWQEQDDITVQLPDGVQVESLPKPRENNQRVVQYVANVTNSGNTLKLSRLFAVDGLMFPVDAYGAIQGFFNLVKAGDDDQVVLKYATVASK
jgi:Domain of Unknown Function with PDB structure (DUF3857)/Transglutaminase-like superfamily